MTIETAYVTGGASGIGRAVVDMLVKRGVRVAIGDSDYPSAQAAARSSYGGLAVEINAADWESQLTGFQQVLQEFGRVDYVYSIAGIGERRWIPNDQTATGFAKPDLSVLDIDLNGLLYTVALAIQQMRRQSPNQRGYKGKIAVVASVCGFYCVPTLPIYTAAKHGVVGFVRSYGKHLAAESITLNAICPNVVKTNISTPAFYEQMASQNLLIPMDTVVEAFERCLDGDISGVTMEIEPYSGITLRSAPEPLHEEAATILS